MPSALSLAQWPQHSPMTTTATKPAVLVARKLITTPSTSQPTSQGKNLQRIDDTIASVSAATFRTNTKANLRAVRFGKEGMSEASIEAAFALNDNNKTLAFVYSDENNHNIFITEKFFKQGAPLLGVANRIKSGYANALIHEGSHFNVGGSAGARHTTGIDSAYDFEDFINGFPF